MRYLQVTCRLLVLLVSLAAGSAGAQQAPLAAAGQAAPQRAAAPPPAPPGAPADKARDTGATPAPGKAGRVRRRSVQQVIDGMPPSPRIATEGYRPTPYPAAPPAPGPQPVAPPPPAQINSCIGAACTDASGALYNGGVGNATINSQGRLCNRSATTMQCF
jgi:pyruvate/2-oxoglutarate dehydrogenase complex dihydrolipoamide acyltransferase (E2) component